MRHPIEKPSPAADDFSQEELNRREAEEDEAERMRDTVLQDLKRLGRGPLLKRRPDLRNPSRDIQM